MEVQAKGSMIRIFSPEKTLFKKMLHKSEIGQPFDKLKCHVFPIELSCQCQRAHHLFSNESCKRNCSQRSKMMMNNKRN